MWLKGTITFTTNRKSLIIELILKQVIPQVFKHDYVIWENCATGFEYFHRFSDSKNTQIFSVVNRSFYHF